MNNKVVKLKNGLTVVIVETPIFKAVRVEVDAKAGPLLENKSNSGITHFVEHMALSGSKQFPDMDKFDEQIEILAGSYNGSTGSRIVNLRIEIPDTELDLGLRFIADAMCDASFPEEKLRTERAAILDEIHGYKNRKYRKFSDYWRKARYIKNRWPLPILGNKTYVKSVSRTDLIEWYRYIFSPDNVTLSIVGNVKIDKALNQVEKYFGSIPKHRNTITPKDWARYHYSDKKISTRVDKNDGEAIGIISFPSLSLLENTYKERQALLIFSSLLADLRSSILYSKLRKERGLLYSINASASFEPLHPGLLDLIFTTSDNKMIDVYTVIFDELENLVKNGISNRQFNLGIEAAINSVKMEDLSLSEIQDRIIPNVIWWNKVRTHEEVIETRKSINLDFMNEIIKKTLQTSSMTVISGVKEKSTKTRIHNFLEERISKLSF